MMFISRYCFGRVENPEISAVAQEYVSLCQSSFEMLVNFVATDELVFIVSFP